MKDKARAKSSHLVVLDPPIAGGQIILFLFLKIPLSVGEERVEESVV